MMPNEAINGKGFWEDLDINALNVEMLQALGCDWHQASLFESSQILQLLESDFAPRAHELLTNKVQRDGVFGFKDPRLGKLFPFWKHIFQQLDFSDVGCLLAIRNPLSVAASLDKRDGLDRTQSYLLWLTHTLNCIKESEEYPRLIVDYDMLIQAPREQITRVARAFDLPIDSDELDEYAVDFLDDELRHHIASLDELETDWSCPSIVKHCYGVLLDIAKDNLDISGSEFLGVTEEWMRELCRIGPLIACVDRLGNEWRRLGARIPGGRTSGRKTSEMAEDILEARLYFSEMINGLPQPYDESRMVAEVYALDGQHKTVRLPVHADLQPLARLRLDIADAPSAIKLDDLILHDASGAELWRWDGGGGFFSNACGVVCLPNDEGLTLLCLNNDPQFELEIPPDTLSLIQNGGSLHVGLTAKLLLTELPRLFASLQARVGEPTMNTARLPVGVLDQMVEVTGLLKVFLGQKNATIAAQRSELGALREQQLALEEQLVRAEAQLDLLKEFMLGGAGSRSDHL